MGGPAVSPSQHTLLCFYSDKIGKFCGHIGCNVTFKSLKLDILKFASPSFCKYRFSSQKLISYVLFNFGTKEWYFTVSTSD